MPIHPVFLWLQTENTYPTNLPMRLAARVLKLYLLVAISEKCLYLPAHLSINSLISSDRPGILRVFCILQLYMVNFAWFAHSPNGCEANAECHQRWWLPVSRPAQSRPPRWPSGAALSFTRLAIKPFKEHIGITCALFQEEFWLQISQALTRTFKQQ